MNTIDIYKLYCKNTEVTDFYIGSSVNAQERYWSHKVDCNNPNRRNYVIKLYTFIREHGGMENWTFEIIDKCEFHLRNQIEQDWIDKLKPTLNMDRAHIRPEERKLISQQYHQDNKEAIHQKKAEYYQANADVIKQKAKEHLESNREAINARRRELAKLSPMITCVCGGVYRECNASGHPRTKQHQEYIKSEKETV
jgi:hypothetical protein